MSTAIPTLERGKACVECRRRKQRCDGGQPKCSVCIRAGRPCRYEVPVRRPVSVVLEERLGRLETRLRNLMTSPIMTSVDNTLSPEPATAIETPGPILIPSTAPSQMSGLWWEAQTLNPAIHDYLLQIFLRYQGRISFYFHLPTLLDRMASPDPQEQPHPCLLNAIYLMACYFSSLEYTHANSLVGHEAHFLARAQAALTDSLSLSDRLLDFLRGSSLVATYLFLRGRHLEGYHVHCGTARFSLSCGLNRITSHEITPPSSPSLTTTVLLPRAEKQLEVGERLMTFWQIYWMDKLYSLLLGFVPALPSEEEKVDTVQTVFPRDLEDYAAENVMDGETESIADLLAPHSEMGLGLEGAARPDTSFTMLLKAITLLARARRLRQVHATHPTDNTVSALKALHLATDRFAATLPPTAASSTSRFEDLSPFQVSVAAARTITLGALIEMNNATADTDPQAHAARLTSAGYISALVFHFGENNVEKACVVTGYSWCLASQVLLDHICRVQPLVPGSTLEADETLVEYEAQLARVLSALEKIVGVYPILGDLCPLTPTGLTTTF